MAEATKLKEFFATLGEATKKLMSSEKPKTDVKVKSVTFTKVPDGFAEVKAKDGTTVISYDGEMPEQGMPIFVINPENGERLVMPDGVVELEDGTKIETMGGLIQTIQPPTAKPAEQGTAPAADMKETGEQTAKRIIESITKESHFTETVSAMIANALKVQEENFAAERTAFKSDNDALVKQIAEVKAENSKLEAKFKKFEEFSKILSEQIETFGEKPQGGKEKKEHEFRDEKEVKPVQSMEEFRKVYMS